MDIVLDVNEEYVEQRTFGQSAADLVARVAGSWTFIIIFILWLLVWAYLNTEVLGPRKQAFDPYPYVFQFDTFYAGSRAGTYHYDVAKSAKCTR